MYFFVYVTMFLQKASKIKRTTSTQKYKNKKRINYKNKETEKTEYEKQSPIYTNGLSEASSSDSSNGTLLRVGVAISV